jgi:hypothetical protein
MMMRRLATILLGATLGLVPVQAYATTVGIILTADELGLGTSDINDGSTVDVDIAGKLVTAPSGTANTNLSAVLASLGYPIINTGSILNIQQSGVAGSGTVLDPLLVRVTAATHLDQTVGAPPSWGGTSREFQSGVIYLSDDNGDTSPTGEGLGVRAFTVTENADPSLAGNRILSGGLAQIEGSKEVSGGTDCTVIGGNKAAECAVNFNELNGAPHVDELAFFDFTVGSGTWDAKNFSFVLTVFGSTDRYWVHVDYEGGSCDEQFNTTTGSGAAGYSSSNLTVNSANFTGGCAGIPAGAKLLDYYIRAVETDTTNPDLSTAEHFLINGFTVNSPTVEAVAEPATLLLFGTGLGLVANQIRRRRRTA